MAKQMKKSQNIILLVWVEYSYFPFPFRFLVLQREGIWFYFYLPRPSINSKTYNLRTSLGENSGTHVGGGFSGMIY